VRVSSPEPAAVRRQVGEVRDAQLPGDVRGELAVHQVRGAAVSAGGPRRQPWFAPSRVSRDELARSRGSPGPRLVAPGVAGPLQQRLDDPPRLLHRVLPGEQARLALPCLASLSRRSHGSGASPSSSARGGQGPLPGVLLARLLSLDGEVHARARIDPQDPPAGLGHEPLRERKPRRPLEHDPDLHADGVTASYRRLSFPRSR
jgi:hypothetical protein